MVRRARTKPKRRRQEFAIHVFDGPRFADHTLDVDVLNDVVAYKALVVAVARRLFVKEGGTGRRRRFPASTFDLAIRTTGQGCYELEYVHSVEDVPFSRLSTPEAHEWLPQTVFTRARDAIADAIRSSSNGHAHFPPDFAVLFKDFGKSLRDNESITMTHPGASTPVRYTRDARARILQAAQTNYEGTIDINGEVVAVDTEEKTFSVKLDEADAPTRIPGEFSQEDEAAILHALGTHDTTRIRIQGTGEYAPNGTLIRIVTAETVAVMRVSKGADAKSLQIDTQTDALIGTVDMGEHGLVTFDPEGLAWVNATLHHITDAAQVRLPYLYPTPERNIQAEWTFDQWEVSATFDYHNKLVTLFAVNVSTGHHLENTAAEPDIGDQMLRFILSYAGSEDTSS